MEEWPQSFKEWQNRRPKWFWVPSPKSRIVLAGHLVWMRGVYLWSSKLNCPPGPWPNIIFWIFLPLLGLYCLSCSLFDISTPFRQFPPVLIIVYVHFLCQINQLFFHSEIHSFYKYWLSTWHIPSILISSSKKETVSFLSEHLVEQGRHAIRWPNSCWSRNCGGSWRHMAGTLDITSKQVTFQLDTEHTVGSLQAKMGQCHVCCCIW